MTKHDPVAPLWELLRPSATSAEVARNAYYPGTPTDHRELRDGVTGVFRCPLCKHAMTVTGARVAMKSVLSVRLVCENAHCPDKAVNE